MLTARLRIQGHDVLLSPQQTVDCNSYNQGCDGGYPFLVEKFGTENYLVTEKSYPYVAKTQKCKQHEAIEEAHTLYGVRDYKFIGGAYGKSTEKNIMEEIHKNGPVVMNFEPQFDFMFYGGGVYFSSKAADWILNKEERPEWVYYLVYFRKKSIIQFCALVGGKKMDKNIGCSKTVGVKNGEIMGYSSKFHLYAESEERN